MRSIHRPLVGLAVVALAFVGAPGALRQTPTTFYPPSDPASDIAAALSAAKKDGKHVLLDFGADWCPDCRVLGALFEDPAVAPYAAANFHIVRIDVGRRDKNAETVAKYSATSGDWIPAIVVLDADGKTAAITDHKVRVTRRTTPAELLALLQQWAPKTPWVELTSFTERGVRVTLALERDSLNQTWLAARFTPTEPGMHLYSHELPLEGIDGLGRPTRLLLIEAAGWTVRGAVVANRPVVDDRIEALNTALPIYPPGAVTLRLPVDLPEGRTRPSAQVSVTYMACGPNGCLPPVVDRRVPVVVR